MYSPLGYTVYYKIRNTESKQLTKILKVYLKPKQYTSVYTCIYYIYFFIYNLSHSFWKSWTQDKWGSIGQLSGSEWRKDRQKVRKLGTSAGQVVSLDAGAGNFVTMSW